MENKMSIVNEKLQDALSLIMLLETDCDMQQSDEVYPRTLRMIHQLLKSAHDDLMKKSE